MSSSKKNQKIVYLEVEKKCYAMNEYVKNENKIKNLKKQKNTRVIPVLTTSLSTTLDGNALPSSSLSLIEQTFFNKKEFQQWAHERTELAKQSGPKICIDCAYNSSMTGKELTSVARQLGRCYSSNRRSLKPVHLILTSWSPESPLDVQCRRVNSGFEKFNLTFDEKKSVYESYPIERLIYLSPNAENDLDETIMNESENILVIGGLVDECVKKNLTYRTCEDKNIKCYRLPIQKYMAHSTHGGSFNQILSINQVFDILLTYLSTKNWAVAFEKHIPSRKGWVVRKTNNSNQEGEEENDSNKTTSPAPIDDNIQLDDDDND